MCKAAPPAGAAFYPSRKFVDLHKNNARDSGKIPEKAIDNSEVFDILSWPAKGQVCDEAGDCGGLAGNFRGVCPARRQRAESGGRAIFRARRISPGRGTAGHDRPVFRTGLIRTVACMEICLRTTGRRRPPKYEFRRKRNGSKGNDPLRLKAYDHQLIDKAAETIVETAKRTEAKVSGPIPLPTKKEVVTHPARRPQVQGQPRAVRAPHAQAPDRHHEPHAEDRRSLMSWSSRGRRDRDQAVRARTS